jgi:hypothetical protein
MLQAPGPGVVFQTHFQKLSYSLLPWLLASLVTQHLGTAPFQLGTLAFLVRQGEQTV